jgi:hypothetical protein
MAAIKTLRGILHEIRLASPNARLKDSLTTQFVLSQFRKYQTTDEQLCKVKDEMNFLGQTYLCYLQSSREYKRIKTDYKGAGERSVESTANLVGFKLPHDPK